MNSVDHNDWTNWFLTNLERGCCIEEMVQLMCRGGVAVDQVRDIMGEHYPEYLDFNSLCSPEIIRSPFAKRIYTDKAQVFWVDDFMDEAECELIMSIMDTALTPSQVTSSNGDNYFRTSSTCYLSEQAHPFVSVLDMRIAQLMGIPSYNSEQIQGQKYEVGQQFKAHTDFFQVGESDYGKFTTPLGQRTWSFMVYLNSTPAGGETLFKELDIEFAPKQGCALVWNNLSVMGYGNDATLHHAKPVLKGTKYVITKWFRTRAFCD